MPRLALLFAAVVAVVLAVVACSAPAAPPAVAPASVPVAVPASGSEVVAAPDAGVPAAVSAAPAWVFRYATAQRTETWTLQHADGAALLVVEAASGTQRYHGTATATADGLALDVTTGSARLALTCKRARRPLGTACNDAKAPAQDLLDCYHPDFAAPMPFGAAPGVEYVVDTSCNGYRLRR